MVTYMRIVTTYRDTKEDPYRVRFTAGGDRIEAEGDVSMQVADLTTTKLLINKALSTPKGRCTVMDVKDYYLGSVRKSPEYLKIPINILPQQIWDQYPIEEMQHSGFVYVEVTGGMYGFRDAGHLAEETLIPRLEKDGYRPVGDIPGLYAHDTNGVVFGLIVDDFLAVDQDDEGRDNLIGCLKKYY